MDGSTRPLPGRSGADGYHADPAITALPLREDDMVIDGDRAHDRATELVLAYYAAFNRGDWATMLAALDEQVAHDINQGERQTGRAAFASFLQRMDRCYSEQIRDLVVMTNEDGSRAAAEYVVEGVYKVADEGLPPAQGQTYRLPGGAFFELRDGLITRVSNYYNLQDWLHQVGAGAS